MAVGGAADALDIVFARHVTAAELAELFAEPPKGEITLTNLNGHTPFGGDIPAFFGRYRVGLRTEPTDVIVQREFESIVPE